MQEKQPSSPQEDQRAENIHDAYRDTIQETREGWTAILEQVKTMPNAPLDSVGALDRRGLEVQYRTVLEERKNALEGLEAIVFLRQNGQVPSRIQKQAVLRTLAKFLKEQHVYDALWRGTALSHGTGIPESLAPFLEVQNGERSALRTASVLLPLQYDVVAEAKIKESPRLLAPLSEEIIATAIRRRMRIHSIIECIENDMKLKSSNAPFEAFLKKAGFQEWNDKDLLATRLLVGFVAKNLESIEQFAEISGKTAEDLTIAEGLECCAGSIAAAEMTREAIQQIPTILTGGRPDMSGSINNTLKNEALYGEKAIHLSLFPLAGMSDNPNNQEQEVFQRDAKVVAEFFRSSNSSHISVQNIDLHIDHMNDAQKRMVRELCARATSEDTTSLLLRSSLVPTVESVQTREEKEVTKALGDIISSKKISARDAFDLYYLSHSKGTNIALAFKAVSILEKHGHPELSTNFQMSRYRKLYDIAKSGLLDFDASIQNLNLSEKEKRELHNVREYLREEGVEELTNWWNRLKAFHKNFPLLAGALDLAVATPVYLFGMKVLRTVAVTKLEKFAKASSETVRKSYNLSESVVTDQQITEAQEQVVELLNEYDRLARRFHWPFKGAGILREAKGVRNALQSAGMSQTEAEATAKELEKDDQPPKRPTTAIPEVDPGDTAKQDADLKKADLRKDVKGDTDSKNPKTGGGGRKG